MSWIVTLKIVDCSATSTLLSGARISSQLLEPYGFVITDANGQAQIYDAYDTWEWVNLTISKGGTGGNPTDPGYDPGYIDKNFVITMSMDGTIQEVCLNKAPPPDPNGPKPIECFIVTAATGSASSEEVTALRALREDIRARSRLANRLIDAIYDEYARFSPQIAAELRGDPGGQLLVLGHVVQPLFAWYRLAAAAALSPEDAEGRAGAAEALARARPREGGAMVLGLLEGLREGSVPLLVPPLLRDLAPRIADYRFAGWAILDPLIRLWRGAGRPFDATAEIADWLADAPLDLLPQPCAACGLADDLDTVAGFLAFAPDRRARLADRLRAAWPDATTVIPHTRLMARMERLGEE